jgi:predicted transposase YbfD/YdcC
MYISAAQLQIVCSTFTDSRINRHKIHNMAAVVFLFLIANIAGLAGWLSVYIWASEAPNLAWLKNFYEYEHGIPSVSTLARIVRSLKPEELDTALAKLNFFILQNMENEISNSTKPGISQVAIDGKTLRGAVIDGKNSKIHLVNAYTDNMVLGQEKVDEKSNEITAIPVILKKLDDKGLLAGVTITMDAMGCQKSLAQMIKEKKAQYVLNLKDNHKIFADEVEIFAAEVVNHPEDFETDRYSHGPEKGHGRITTWSVIQVNVDYRWLPSAKEWEGIKTIIMVVRATYSGYKYEKYSEETNYYISSLPLDAETMFHIVRSHWGVETLHLYLDTTFKEDDSRIRVNHGGENCSSFRKMAFNILKPIRDKGPYSMKTLQDKCARDPNFLKEILGLNETTPSNQPVAVAA